MIPKFRAWDKVDKEKYFADEINFNCGEFESIGNGIHWKWYHVLTWGGKN